MNSGARSEARPLQATLIGVGHWSERLPSVGALVEGRPLDAPLEAPAAKLLPGRLRRRASRVTRLCAEVLDQAVGPLAGAEAPLRPRIVAASAWGEIQITVDLLGAIARDELLSPTAFHNSVHNAALGYLSIATANERPSVAIAAGDFGVAMGALESIAAVVDDGGACVFIAVEERVPAPFCAADDERPSVAMAWVLAPPAFTPPSGVARSRVTLVRAMPLDGASQGAHHRSAPRLPIWLQGGPLGAMAAVTVAHAERRSALVDLGAGWHLELSPAP